MMARLLWTVTQIRISVRKLHSTVLKLAPKSLMVRYTMALTAIGALIALEQVIIQVTLQRQADGQRLMRLVDRQQAENMRLSKIALSNQLASSEAEVRKQLRALLEASEEITNSHDALKQDLTEYQNAWFGGALRGRDSSLDASFVTLGLNHTSLWQKTLQRPLTPGSRFALRKSLEQVRSGTQTYRAELEFLFAALDHVTQDQYRSATRIEFCLFALLLCVLLFQGLYVFRPSVRGLEEALKVRSDFMSRISHEIRNPMNAIMGMTDILRETPLNDLQTRYLSTLAKSSHTLLELLNSLLDFSALESGKTRIEKIQFDILDVLAKAVDVSAVRAHEKGLDVFLDVDPRTPLLVTGDPVRLHQVLTNLLSNAVKFTEKGEVKLSVRPELRGESEQYLLFSVQDTGIGINTKSLARIFDSFVQADSSTRRKYGGTGLGLTISRELVQLMGGQLSVTSEVGQGSLFSFSIPVGAASLTTATLESTLVRIDLSNTTALCLGPMHGALDQAASLIRLCGGHIESRLEAVDLSSPRTLVLVSPDDDDSIFQFFPERFPRKARILCLLKTAVSAPRMRSLLSFGVTEFVLAPLKPLEFLQTVARRQLPSLNDRPDEVSTETPDLDRTMRILVADDSPENREIVRLYLSREKVHLEFAADGAQAVQKFQSESFDLVFMDIQMPILDGTEAFTSIRNWESSRNQAPTPIIALTADDRPEQRQNLLTLGFSALLVKPLRKNQLLALVQSARRCNPSANQNLGAEFLSQWSHTWND